MTKCEGNGTLAAKGFHQINKSVSLGDENNKSDGHPLIIRDNR